MMVIRKQLAKQDESFNFTERVTGKLVKSIVLSNGDNSGNKFSNHVTSDDNKKKEIQFKMDENYVVAMSYINHIVL